MPGLTPELVAQARKMVFDHFREHAVPPVLEDVMRQFELGREDAFAVLRALEDAHHLKLVPGTQRILMAFPFSAIATPFRVTANNQRYFANCAWDADRLSMRRSASRSASTRAAIIAPRPSKSCSRTVACPARTSQIPECTSRSRPPAGGRTSSSPARITWCSSSRRITSSDGETPTPTREASPCRSSSRIASASRPTGTRCTSNTHDRRRTSSSRTSQASV